LPCVGRRQISTGLINSVVVTCYALNPPSVSAERIRLFVALVLRSLSGTLREIPFAATIHPQKLSGIPRTLVGDRGFHEERSGEIL